MLTKETLKKYKKEYDNDKTNKIKQRMLKKTSLIDAIQENEIEINQEFNLIIKTHGITDQKSSGACWAYAGLNILRERAIEKLNIDSFELSQSYVAYYDKLEKFNLMMEKLISYKNDNKDLYDREVSSILRNGITSSAYVTQLANIIDKYGILPKKIFPETYASSNAYETNQILSRLLRKFYLELEKSKNINELQEEYMKKAYTIISNLYGTPKEKFDFEYTDKQGNYHIEQGITPKEFYKKYIDIDLLNDYIEIISYEDEKIKYNEMYQEKESSRMSGTEDVITLNINQKEFDELILKQLKQNIPVFFHCSTTIKRIDGIYTDLLQRYGEMFDVDLELDNNSVLKTNGITGCHAMIITGANIVDGKVTRYKLEDSYGSSYGKNGYWSATKDWAEKYINRIVINKNLLTKKQQEILKQKPIKVESWDCKF